jgi:DNA recombination protein RmuC
MDLYIFLVLIVILLITNVILTLKATKKEPGNDLNEIKNAINSFNSNLKEEFAINRKENSENAKEGRTELRENLNDLNLNTASRLDSIRDIIEKKITQLQEGNEKKLDDMRKTVDEKLSDTLDKRLGESFKQVSERLEAVHKGLGDMQNLAISVGDLKKVMNNVKSRGVLGEYQLQNLLEDLLTNEQYEKNVKTKVGSGAVVEFAIKMPHGNNIEKTLWLPVDSKFPKEDYEALVDAYEKGDIEKIEEFRKAFVKGIRKSAQDIKEKYIDPPNTTEYGIMFLPYESLFGEVLRTPGLFEQLQRDYKITITGPTTLSALLNSLQMGFRTLAIEKRSSEVWDLLGAVKTEFGQFGEVLAKTKKKLIEATNVIESSELRSRVIEKKLRNVQELPTDKTNLILDNIHDEMKDNSDENK